MQFVEFLPWINVGGLEQQGLFQVNGNAETVEWLRQRYDSGEEVDLVKEADVPSAISLLRFFLQELPEPVIPGSFHIHLMQLSQGNKIWSLTSLLTLLSNPLLFYKSWYVNNNDISFLIFSHMYIDLEFYFVIQLLSCLWHYLLLLVLMLVLT